jgi:hypothetical protein
VIMLRRCCLCDRRIFLLPARHFHPFGAVRKWAWCHRACLLAMQVHREAK